MTIRAPAFLLVPALLSCALLAAADHGAPAATTGALGKAAEGFVESAKATTKAEIIKQEMGLLVQTAQLSDPATAEETAKKIADAVNRMEMNARETREFFARLRKMDRGELSKLARQKGNGVLAYGRAILAGQGGDIAAVKAALASGGDQASLDAVRLLRRLEEGRVVSPAEFQAIIGRLPPRKANSLIDAVRAEVKLDGPLKRQFFDSVGTMVDGVFVFNDAVNLYYSDAPPEEKVGAAVGKGVELGLGTVGGIAAGVVGGGLGAGIVIGWSSAQVAELTTEMIGLYYDRQNAALKEQWARLELREMAIRRMLEVDRLMKAGRLDDAQEQSRRLREFYEERKALIDDELVGQKLAELREHVARARDRQSALFHLNEARRPYSLALASYEKRVALTQARLDARKARQVLEPWVSSYPELAEPLGAVRELETAIATAIASATPLRISRVEAPSQLRIGDSAAFHFTPSGGIPFYCEASRRHCGTSSVTVHFYALGAPGPRTLSFSFHDDLKQTTRAEVTVELLPGNAPAPSAGARAPAITGGVTGGDPGSICERAQRCCTAWARANPFDFGHGQAMQFPCNYGSASVAQCQQFIDANKCK